MYALQVLEESLLWLNNWEKLLKGGKIEKGDFLTRSTAEGLRVTLQSTIELTNFLLDECDYKYVLTGKMNQDCLEV